MERRFALLILFVSLWLGFPAGANVPQCCYSPQLDRRGNTVLISDEAGLLTNRTAGVRATTVSSFDGVGRPLSLSTVINQQPILTETMTWTGDGLLAGDTLQRADFTDSRSYSYADLSRRLVEERLNLDASKRWTNAFVFDNGTSGGLGVLTKAGSPVSSSANWTGAQDTFSRIKNETNTVIRRPAYGNLNGPSALTATLDGLPQALSVAGTNGGQWRATLELTPGAHQLEVTAKHPSGQFQTNAVSWFTNTASTDRTADTYDASGLLTQRVWTKANGQTNRTQTLSWDGRGRLCKIIERDYATNGSVRITNGFNWTATYDPLGRRLQTTTIIVTNSITLNSQPSTIAQYYDPAVEFLELGVSVDGKSAWKLYGPDLSGKYGGLQGVGGLESIKQEGDLSGPVIADARGNELGVYQVTLGMQWHTNRPTGYGAAPGYRPPAFAAGVSLASASSWRGRWADVTGIYWLGSRYYDPIAGRFLSADPLGHGSDPGLYGFCNGDVINRFDADGRLGKRAYNEAALDASAVFSSTMWGGMASDSYNIGARTANGIVQAGAIGSDMIGQNAASLFGYGADYQGYSQLYQSIYNNPGSGPTSGQILMGTVGAEVNTASLGLYGMGKGFGTAAATGDYSQAQDAALNAILLSSATRTMQNQGVNPWGAGYTSSSLAADTGGDLTAAANRAAQTVGAGRGPVYGTRVHSAFENEVNALGNGNLTTEQSYLNGNVVTRGTAGSVRLDVVEGPLDAPTAVYDLKTGSAKLTPGRIQQIHSHIPGGSSVPVTVVRP